MSAATSAPLRSWRVLARELVTFGGVGAVAFVVQIGLFNLLVHHGIGPLSSNAVAMIVSCGVAFVGNRGVSFRHRRGRRMAGEAAGFLLVNVATFGLGEAVLATAYLVGREHDRLVINTLTVLGIGLGTVIRFWAYRRFVFVPPVVDDRTIEPAELVSSPAG